MASRRTLPGKSIFNPKVRKGVESLAGGPAGWPVLRGDGTVTGERTEEVGGDTPFRWCTLARRNVVRLYETGDGLLVDDNDVPRGLFADAYLTWLEDQ